MAIISAENIIHNYGEQRILKGITLSVDEGSFTAILGHSGSGKSTLLNVLSGLLKPTGGTVKCNDTVITNLSVTQLADWRRDFTGSVFQNYLLLNNLTAEENIRVGISPKAIPLDYEKLVQLLEIDDILNKFPAQLSGGQQQRVAIARAVIKGTHLLFCDEATGSLDEDNSKKVVGLLHRLKKMFGVTVLFTTHNKQIAQTADRILTIKNGMIYGDVVNKNPISAYEMVWA